MRMEATITARGADSHAPGHPGAVDAELFTVDKHGDVFIGAVTLLPREDDGRLDEWGPVHVWADEDAVKLARNPQHRAEIIDAVREADAREREEAAESGDDDGIDDIGVDYPEIDGEPDDDGDPSRGENAEAELPDARW